MWAGTSCSVAHVTQKFQWVLHSLVPWGKLFSSCKFVRMSCCPPLLNAVEKIPGKFLSCSYCSYWMFGSLTLLRLLIILQVFMNVKEEFNSINTAGSLCRYTLCGFNKLAQLYDSVSFRWENFHILCSMEENYFGEKYCSIFYRLLIFPERLTQNTPFMFSTHVAPLTDVVKLEWYTIGQLHF